MEGLGGQSMEGNLEQWRQKIKTGGECGTECECGTIVHLKINYE